MFKTALLRFETSGIRSLREPVAFDTYSKKTLTGFDQTQDRVRVLYGPNGSGKTSVVLSLWVLSSLMKDWNYLARCGGAFFEKLLNNATQHFTISVLFASMFDDEEKLVNAYRYQLDLALERSMCVIEAERLDRQVGPRVGARFENVFATHKGKLESFNTSMGPDFFASFKEASNNLFAFTTVLRLFMKHVADNNLKEAFFSGVLSNKDNRAIESVIEFLLSLHVSIASVDLHEDIMPVSADILDYLRDATKEELVETLTNSLTRENRYSFFVDERDIDDYRSLTKRQREFIRVFKPGLKDIRLEETPSEGKIRCRKIFVYEEKEIDFEFESTGIQKMANLFTYLELAAKGYCVFIDELDANISGVYLKKLVEYMNTYGHGQLFFTCHSLDPMYALAGNKKAIYFLNEDNHVHTWTKSSHYRPYILYPDGMIPGIPFDIEPLDFASCFETEE